MAFTSEQLHKIRTYLGYPSHGADIDNIDSEVNLTSSDGETTVISILSRLDAINSSINSDAADSAGIKGIDRGGIEFYEGKKLSELKQIGKTLVTQLEVITGITKAADYFSSCSGSSGGGSVWSFY